MDSYVATRQSSELVKASSMEKCANECLKQSLCIAFNYAPCQLFYREEIPIEDGIDVDHYQLIPCSLQRKWNIVFSFVTYELWYIIHY